MHGKIYKKGRCGKTYSGRGKDSSHFRSDPLVSSDIIENASAAIVDMEMTRVVDGDLVKVMVWYDNEWGFSNQMVRQILSL